MSETITGRQWHLAARPTGTPTPGNFRLETVQLSDLQDGEVLVRNLFLSVDPYMRGRMNDVPSYVPPFRLDAPLTGGAVGEVLESKSDALVPGDLVLHDYGWREFGQGPARHFRRVDRLDGVPDSAHLGALGMVGLTAWVGLLEVAHLQPGEVVFVSGAAGAVGSLVGQIAKLRGASLVIGSAGSDEKVERLKTTYGYDVGFNYRAGPVNRQLRDAAPTGIDVYFDNVGGEHLEAAIFAFRNFGRAAICGAISAYNSSEPPAAPRNLPLIIGKGVSLNGFLVSHHQDRAAQATAEIAGWLASGQLQYQETVVDGVENTATAFLDLLSGGNTGKMIVRLA